MNKKSYIEELADAMSLSAEEKKLLLEYVENAFKNKINPENAKAADISIWDNIIEIYRKEGAEAAYNKTYARNYPVKFRHPEKIRIEIADSFAGKIPITYIEDREDFEDLNASLFYKGEHPESLAEMGAQFVMGKNTQFIILSAKPYSNVTAQELQLDSEEWLEKSMLIRKSHECTHLYTRKIYGTARNNLHDEIIADFMGIYDAFGYYNADYFLKFMGVLPSKGNRIIVYTKDLPQKVVKAIMEIAKTASKGLEKWSKTPEFLGLTKEERITKLCEIGLDGMCEL